MTVAVLSISTLAQGGGKSTVIVYSLSTSTTLGQVRKPIFLDDKEIADVRPEHFFVAMIPAGKHTLNLKNKKFGGIERDFEAGKTYYLRIDWRNNGMALVPQGFVIVPEENGAFDVRQLKPIDTGNIKDKSLISLQLPK